MIVRMVIMVLKIWLNQRLMSIPRLGPHIEDDEYEEYFDDGDHGAGWNPYDQTSCWCRPPPLNLRIFPQIVLLSSSWKTSWPNHLRWYFWSIIMMMITFPLIEKSSQKLERLTNQWRALMPIVNKTRAAQIIKSHTQIIKGKKQIGADRWIGGYTCNELRNHNLRLSFPSSSFSPLHSMSSSSMLPIMNIAMQYSISSSKRTVQHYCWLTLGLQTKLNWTSSRRLTLIVAISLSKEFEDPWSWLATLTCDNYKDCGWNRQ